MQYQKQYAFLQWIHFLPFSVELIVEENVAKVAVSGNPS